MDTATATARLVAGTAVRSPTPQGPPYKLRIMRDAKPLPSDGAGDSPRRQLASTARPALKLRQVEKTLPSFGKKAASIRAPRHVRTSCRCLRCDNAAHAVADHDAGSESPPAPAHTGCVAIQADLARRRVVVAHPRQVERLHYMTSLP